VDIAGSKPRPSRKETHDKAPDLRYVIKSCAPLLYLVFQR
jgi:hypothetical protein